MTLEIRAAYIDKLVLYVNASIEVCCWGALPVAADYYETYSSINLIDTFGKEMIGVVVEAKYGWIREDHLGQTHKEYLQSQEREKHDD
jgi:hypothetical protein